MNAAMQVKLLRVLQERRFRRLGGTDEVRADVRVIAATNQELPRLVAEGRFREDLFYRINVIGVHLPSLRERLEDIPLLADHFLVKYAGQMDKPIRAISREAQELLAAYRWPGNVRELENAIERAVAVEQTPTLLPESLPPQVRPNGERLMETEVELLAGLPEFPALQAGFDLEARGEDFYRHYISLALERSGGVQTRAAELLGMSFRSFRYYAKKFNLR
jgi:two-component system response regulator PilR (NtrC family)